MNDIPQIANINQYHQHFRNEAQYIKNQPRVDRSCNDKCCYVVFIILTLLLLGGGLYFISKATFNTSSYQASQYSTMTANSSSSGPYQIENLKPGIPIILAMIALSVVLAILFLCLLVKFPKCIFYTMLIVGAILIIALSILFFTMGQYVAGGIGLAILVFYGIFLYCFKDQMMTGIMLLETASDFVMEKPSVFLAPIILGIVVFAFELFWLVSLVAITLYPVTASSQDQANSYQTVSTIFGILWVFLQFFYTFFFYYCIVFIIATAVALWYYKVDDNFFYVGLKRIVANHLGSLTFAAIIVALIELARRSVQRQADRSQGPAYVCLCILSCCIGLIQDLVQTLNHNAIITMSVTGESYIDSAKSTLSLIFDNFPLFFLIDIMSTLIKVVGIVFICGIPAIIGFFLLKATAQNPDDENFLVYSTSLIVLVAILVAIIFLSVLSEALSCIFIFYCLDCKLVKMGYPAPQRVPDAMRKLFNGLNKSGSDYNSVPPSQGQGNYDYGNSQPNNYGNYGNYGNNANNYYGHY